MRYITCEIPESVANIFPLGDLHLSDKSFRKKSYKKLKEIISFIGENPNSRIVFGGDLFNMAGRNTKSSPFEARLSVNDEMNELVSFFYPIKDKIVGAIGGNHECFDSETEILSEDGWLGYEKITKDTTIYTYNKEKDLIEKEKPKAIQVYNFNGNLNRIIGKNTDLLITDNHRIFYKPGSGIFRMNKFSEIPKKRNRLTLICSGQIEQKEYPIKDDELRILAWLLTDGSMIKKQIKFYQRESKHKMITDILDRLGWKYSIYKRDRDIKKVCGKKLKKKCEVSCDIRLVSPDNHRLVELTNNEKVIPEFIYNLSERQFDLFLQSFIDGDGSRHKSSPETSLMVYGTKKTVEDLQRACFLHGYRTSISEYRKGDYRLNITKNRYCHIDDFGRAITSEKYNGIIWDVTTPNDTVIVRRNGKISITGNSRAKDEFDIDIMEVFCSKIEIPYLGYSGVINFRVGKKNAKSGGQWNQNYYGYFHHTTGGGSTIGSGLNRVEKLNNIVEGCDFYCGFHSHKTSYANSLIYTANHRSKKIEEREIHFITCGGYLEYPDSYAEKGMMRPVVVGSPMIILEGNKRKISFVN